VRLSSRIKLGVAALLMISCGRADLANAQAADPYPVYATDTCGSNAWLIPFDEGKAELGEFAQKRLGDLVAAWRVDAGPLLASGRVDGREEGRYPGLSQRRLQAVVQALIKRGVPADSIWTRDDGGKNGFVENQPSVSEPQNRIVLATLARGGDQCARNMVKARHDWLERNCSFSHPKAGKVACDDALSRPD
jgi:hypothetical protein